MIDIHTHLFFPQYDDDRDEVLKRAFDAGIKAMISVSTSPEDHKKALEISQLDNRIYASLGLHPHHCNDLMQNHLQNVTSINLTSEKLNTILQKKIDEDVAEIKKLIESNDTVIAVGECGLDYYTHTDEVVTEAHKKMQKYMFAQQINLAQEHDLPLILHCRPSAGTQDAYEDLYEILQHESRHVKCILHCYMGDTEITKKLLSLSGVYFSFTGNITYSVKKLVEGTKDDIRETVKRVPLERMLMETDCPFLAPMPYRGKRNEPSFVMEVQKQILQLHATSEPLLYATMSKTIDDIFSLKIECGIL